MIIGGGGRINSTKVKTRADDLFNTVLAGTHDFDHLFLQNRTDDRFLDASG